MMATKVRKPKVKSDRSPGRPRVHEKFGPLAYRAVVPTCIPVYLEPREAIALEAMGRIIGMERATLGRVILRKAIEIGLEGNFSMPEVARELREYLEQYDTTVGASGSPG